LNIIYAKLSVLHYKLLWQTPKLIFFKFIKTCQYKQQGNKQVVKSFDEMTDKQVDNAIAQSANTFKTGKNILSREAAVCKQSSFDEREKQLYQL
jgi:hypothetical protein